MKTMVDIPTPNSRIAVRFTQATTAREAVVLAVTDFNQRQRMRELAGYAGTCPDLITVDELRDQRRR